MAKGNDGNYLQHSVEIAAAELYSAIDVPEDFIRDAVEEIEDVALAAAMQASEREFTARGKIMNILENDRGDAFSAKLRA